MATLKDLTGNVFFWIDDVKIARFPVSLYSLNDFVFMSKLLTSDVYTKMTIETPALTKEFPISPATK